MQARTLYIDVTVDIKLYVYKDSRHQITDALDGDAQTFEMLLR